MNAPILAVFNAPRDTVYKKVVHPTSDGGKVFIPYRYENGQWIRRLNGIKLIPYKLPNILSSDTIYYFEGEKDVETAISCGLNSSTTLGSCHSKLEKHQYKYFANKTIILVSDLDDKGLQFADRFSKELYTIAKQIYILKLPLKGTKEEKDFSDLIEMEPKLKNKFLEKGIRKTTEILMQYSTQYIDDSEKIKNSVIEKHKCFQNEYLQYLKAPIEVLPKVMKDYITKTYKYSGLPKEFILAPMLSILGAVIGKSYCFKDNGASQWTEYPCFWTAIVAEPSEKKSAVIEPMMSVIKQSDEENYTAYERQCTIYRDKLRRYKIANNKGNPVDIPDEPKILSLFPLKFLFCSQGKTYFTPHLFSCQSPDLMLFEARVFDDSRVPDGNVFLLPIRPTPSTGKPSSHFASV